MDAWEKLLVDQWQGCDLPHIEESLRVGELTVVPKNIISAQLMPEVCAELDTETGALTLVDSEFGVEVDANGILLLAQFIADCAPIVAMYVLKVEG